MVHIAKLYSAELSTLQYARHQCQKTQSTLQSGDSRHCASLSQNLGRIHVNGGWPRQLLPLLVKT